MKYIIPILGGAALALAGPIPSSTRPVKITETSSSNALINTEVSMGQNSHVSTVLNAVPTHTHGPYAVVANLSAADRLDAPGSSSGLWGNRLKKEIEEEKRTGRKLLLKELDHELNDIHGTTPSIAKRNVATSAAFWLHAAKEMMEAGEPVLDMEEWSRLLEHRKEHEVKSNVTDPPLAYKLERADRFDEIAHIINEEVEELDQLHKEGLPEDQFTKIALERIQKMQDASAEIDRLFDEMDAEKKDGGATEKPLQFFRGPQYPGSNHIKDADDEFLEQFRRFHAEIEEIENVQDEESTTNIKKLKERLDRWEVMEDSLMAEITKEAELREQEVSQPDEVTAKARRERSKESEQKVSRWLKHFREDEEKQNKEEGKGGSPKAE